MATPQSIVPTLQIISGPFTGQLFTLERDVTIIGRNPECDIVLQPKSVSRRHAAIVRKEGGFLLRDMGSTRGTFLNGVKLTHPVMLQDGNTVQIGELLLTFSSRLVSIQDGDEEQSTVYAAIDVVNQSSSKNFPVVRPEVKLRALRLISQELGGTLVLSELLDRIFTSLFELFPRAERGFVLVRDPASQTLVPEAIRSRTGPPGELTISKTVLSRVLDDGQAILSKDLAKEFPESQSVSESEIRSLMCVPLLDQDRKPVGIMQIDTRDGRGRFDQDDLDLLVAVASQISVAVQNARLHKALRAPARDGAGAPVRPAGDDGPAAGAAGLGAGLRVLGVLRAGPARRRRLLRLLPDRARPRRTPAWRPAGRSRWGTSSARGCRRPC